MLVGRKALEVAGLPTSALEAALKLSKEMNIMISIRAGTPPNVGYRVYKKSSTGMFVQPKDIYTKTKTTPPDGPDFLAGYIPMNQALFGRSSSKPLPPNSLGTHLYISLREILLSDMAADPDKGQYSDLQCVDNSLQFTAPHANTEAKRSLIYRLNLDKSKRRDPVTSHAEAIAQMKDSAIPEPSTPQKPKGWDDEKYGSFTEALDKLYPVSYQEPSNEIKSLLVVAKEGAPVTGDIDLFAIGLPPEKQNIKKYNKRYDGAKAEEREKLISAFHDLCHELGLGEREWSNSTEEFAKHVGIITPYEFFTIRYMNDEVSKTILHLYTKNLFQHGPETNHPGDASSISSLEGDILHIYNGLIVLTRTEDQLVEFISMMRSKGQCIRVHPYWNMEKWACVVQEQIAAAQAVRTKTLQKYTEFTRQGGISSAPVATGEHVWNSDAFRAATAITAIIELGEEEDLLTTTISEEGLADSDTHVPPQASPVQAAFSLPWSMGTNLVSAVWRWLGQIRETHPAPLPRPAIAPIAEIPSPSLQQPVMHPSTADQIVIDIIDQPAARPIDAPISPVAIPMPMPIAPAVPQAPAHPSQSRFSFFSSWMGSNRAQPATPPQPSRGKVYDV